MVGMSLLTKSNEEGDVTFQEASFVTEGGYPWYSFKPKEPEPKFCEGDAAQQHSCLTISEFSENIDKFLDRLWVSHQDGCLREDVELCEDAAAVLLRLRKVLERNSEWIRSRGVDPDVTYRIRSVLLKESQHAWLYFRSNFAGDVYNQITYGRLDVYTGRPMKDCMEIDLDEAGELDFPGLTGECV